jgi:hypothetical protein
VPDGERETGSAIDGNTFTDKLLRKALVQGFGSGKVSACAAQ